MTPNSLIFDHWIRNRFVELNSELEELYSNQSERTNVKSVGDNLKRALEDEGREIIKTLLSEGNTDEGFDNAFDLLGNVGLYMAACRRHEITDPAKQSTSPLKEASGLAMNIGASIGVTPRFATAHLSTHITKQLMESIKALQTCLLKNYFLITTLKQFLPIKEPLTRYLNCIH